jgi:poly(3-hydroxybutyrate) depolymerase
MRGGKLMKTILLLLALASCAVSADAPPPVAPPYYAVSYEASDKPGELAMPVTYTIWIPEGVKTLRGVIVHQHGCGKGSGVTGRTAAYDLHWQALARKWDCALLGPSYQQLTDKDCRNWCDPRNGSDAAFQKALAHFADESKHPELTSVPWCLWGHSGGGFWSSLMLTLHPERIAAIFYRSGSAYAVWERGEIPKPVLTPAVYEVPFMFIGGVKEAQDKSHGPARIGDRAMLKAWREHGAPGGLASDPLSGHECGDSRYLAIAFFDACLAQRLPDTGNGTQTLKPVNMKLAWLAVPDSNTAQPAGEFAGDKAAAHWLPDDVFAKAWSSYNQTGRPADTTPPPAPTNVGLSADGELTWSAEADLESGLGGFIIERDGKEFARLPEKPVGKLGTPLFQGLSGGDTPVIATPPMSFKDANANPGKKHHYAVRSVNAVGLASPASAANVNAKP